MPSLELTGTELFYETHGSGPILVFIAGAGGSGAIFHQAAHFLSQSFTVVTYDRRGHSQSYLNGDQDYSQRLERDADDVAELIKHVSSTTNQEGEPSAYVLGTSSGAIVSIKLLSRHPTLINKLVAHEPPMFNALQDPVDRRREIDETRRIYDIYRARGLHTAMADFSKVHMASEDLGGLSVAVNPRTSPYIWGNMLYWFEREMCTYTATEVPWTELEKPDTKKKLIVAVSENGSHCPAGRTAVSLAKQLFPEGDRLVTLPGAHLGYVTQPERFSSSLTSCLTV